MWFIMYVIVKTPEQQGVELFVVCCEVCWRRQVARYVNAHMHGINRLSQEIWPMATCHCARRCCEMTNGLTVLLFCDIHINIRRHNTESNQLLACMLAVGYVDLYNAETLLALLAYMHMQKLCNWIHVQSAQTLPSIALEIIFIHNVCTVSARQSVYTAHNASTYTMYFFL